MELRIGTHSLRRAGDVLFLQVTGEFSPADARDYVRVRDHVLNEQHYLFLVIDIVHATALSSEARRVIARATPNPYAINHLVVMYGASLTMRTLLQLLFAAVRNILNRPVHAMFVRDEAEALRLIDEHRPQLLARVAAQGS